MGKWAALAGALAGAARWDDMETLLSMLAQQAAAGARADLLPLMQVRGRLRVLRSGVPCALAHVVQFVDLVPGF